MKTNILNGRTFIKQSNVWEGIQSLLILFFCFLLGRLLLIRSNNFRSPIAVTICGFYKQIRSDFSICESVQKGAEYSLFIDSIKIIFSRSLENSFVS